MPSPARRPNRSTHGFPCNYLNKNLAAGLLLSDRFGLRLLLRHFSFGFGRAPIAFGVRQLSATANPCSRRCATVGSVRLPRATKAVGHNPSSATSVSSLD